LGCEVDRRLHAVVPVAGGVATGLQDVGGVFASHVTLCLVVADGEVSSHVAAGVGQALRRAVDSSAADLSGVHPDHLGKVTPLVEVGRRRVLGFRVVGVQAIVEGDLAVVEQLSDDRGDVVSLDTSSDVLAVSSAVHVPMQS
jgi:hypothetical protein